MVLRVGSSKLSEISSFYTRVKIILIPDKTTIDEIATVEMAISRLTFNCDLCRCQEMMRLISMDNIIIEGRRMN